MRLKLLALLLLANAILASSHLAEAQQTTGKLPRIGFVSGTGDANNPGPNLESFQQSLRDLGYIEGKNILVEYRYAAGRNERFPTLVAELVNLKVDLFFSTQAIVVRAAKQATKTIPIVMAVTPDPVAAGWSIVWHARAETLPG
jgi:putative ABC transport system substrate-binding protein